MLDVFHARHHGRFLISCISLSLHDCCQKRAHVLSAHAYVVCAVALAPRSVARVAASKVEQVRPMAEADATDVVEYHVLDGQELGGAIPPG